MFDELSFINTAQKIKILKPFKKSISIPRIDEKKLPTQEFQLKGISKRWDASCFRVFQTIVTYCHWKRCFFRTFQMHFSNISKVNLKLLIPEILFMLVLCNFDFYFKITTTTISDPASAKTFLKCLTCPNREGMRMGEGVHAIILLLIKFKQFNKNKIKIFIQ